MPQFKIYPGSKAVPGLYQWLINNTPYHKRYFEIFAGMGGLFYNKKPAHFNFLSDMSESCIAYHRENAPPGTHIRKGSAFDVLDLFPFEPDDFIYADPPYPKDARSSGAEYYEHEMMEEERHVDLLQRLMSVPAQVAISTRENQLYSEVLSGWRKETFLTGSHSGAVEEIIYMNYPKPTFLHQYNHLGDGNITRQAITRKKSAFAKKIAKMDPYQRHALIIEMIQADPSAVQHFLSS